MKRSGISPAQMLQIYKSVTLPMLSSYRNIWLVLAPQPNVNGVIEVSFSLPPPTLPIATADPPVVCPVLNLSFTSSNGTRVTSSLLSCDTIPVTATIIKRWPSINIRSKSTMSWYGASTDRTLPSGNTTTTQAPSSMDITVAEVLAIAMNMRSQSFRELAASVTTTSPSLSTSKLLSLLNISVFQFYPLVSYGTLLLCTATKELFAWRPSASSSLYICTTSTEGMTSPTMTTNVTMAKSMEMVAPCSSAIGDIVWYINGLSDRALIRIMKHTILYRNNDDDKDENGKHHTKRLLRIHDGSICNLRLLKNDITDKEKDTPIFIVDAIETDDGRYLVVRYGLQLHAIYDMLLFHHDSVIGHQTSVGGSSAITKAIYPIRCLTFEGMGGDTVAYDYLYIIGNRYVINHFYDPALDSESYIHDYDTGSLLSSYSEVSHLVVYNGHDNDPCDLSIANVNDHDAARFLAISAHYIDIFVASTPVAPLFSKQPQLVCRLLDTPHHANEQVIWLNATTIAIGALKSIIAYDLSAYFASSTAPSSSTVTMGGHVSLASLPKLLQLSMSRDIRAMKALPYTPIQKRYWWNMTQRIMIHGTLNGLPLVLMPLIIEYSLEC
jgi:hypothetical protein